MKARHFICIAVTLLLIILLSTPDLMAQCSICTKVAADQGEGAAKGFNAGILYLAAIPLSMVGILGYRWYKYNLPSQEEES